MGTRPRRYARPGAGCRSAALPRLSSFESRHPGALKPSSVRRSQTGIIDEIRKVNRRPGMVELPEDEADEAPSPLDYAMAREGFERYEAASSS
jgi:hypothetical protein